MTEAISEPLLMRLTVHEMGAAAAHLDIEAPSFVAEHPGLDVNAGFGSLLARELIVPRPQDDGQGIDPVVAGIMRLLAGADRIVVLTRRIGKRLVGAARIVRSGGRMLIAEEIHPDVHAIAVMDQLQARDHLVAMLVSEGGDADAAGAGRISLGGDSTFPLSWGEPTVYGLIGTSPRGDVPDSILAWADTDEGRWNLVASSNGRELEGEPLSAADLETLLVRAIDGAFVNQRGSLA